MTLVHTVLVAELIEEHCLCTAPKRECLRSSLSSGSSQAVRLEVLATHVFVSQTNSGTCLVGWAEHVVDVAFVVLVLASYSVKM